MAYLEIYQTLPRHRKTLRVARLLGLDRQKAVGLLLDLWTWGLDNADKNGFLGDVTAEELAEVTGWPRKKAKAFVTALTAGDEISPHGFLETDIAGHYIFHNWHRYAGKLNERREQERMRSQRRREEQTSGQPVADHEKTDGQTSGQPAVEIAVDREKTCGTVPNRTLPCSKLSYDNSSTCADGQPDLGAECDAVPDACPHQEIMALYNAGAAANDASMVARRQEERRRAPDA